MNDILSSRRIVAPTEVTSVKAYILEKYKSPCSVKLTKSSLILSLPNSALAATVHMERLDLIKDCSIDKRLRLVIRTGR